mgnify:CR=1 FL=1
MDHFHEPLYWAIRKWVLVHEDADDVLFDAASSESETYDEPAIADTETDSRKQPPAIQRTAPVVVSSIPVSTAESDLWIVGARLARRRLHAIHDGGAVCDRNDRAALRLARDRRTALTGHRHIDPNKAMI